MSTTARLTQTKSRLDDFVRRELAMLFGKRALIFICVFLVLAVTFHIVSNGVFLTPRNLSLLLRQGSMLAILAGGVAILLIMSEIDLSIGSAVFLCGVLAAEMTVSMKLPVLLAIIVTVVFGVVLGAIQGAWVVLLGIPSFIVTLAGMLAFRGIGLMWTNAATVGPVPESFIALSEAFIPVTVSFVILGILLIVGVTMAVLRVRNVKKIRFLETGTQLPASQTGLLLVAKTLVIAVPIGLLFWIVGGFQGIPMALVFVGVIITVFTIVMSKTRFGRNAYLLGSSREAAQYSGLGVRRSIFVGFLIMGALYGVVGVLLTARLGSSTPGAGEFLELDAIAAAVIGGVSLRGGTGTVVGAVMGAFLLTMINNGMSILNISSFAQLVIKALILLVALAFDAYVLRKSAR